MISNLICVHFWSHTWQKKQWLFAHFLFTVTWSRLAAERCSWMAVSTSVWGVIWNQYAANSTGDLCAFVRHTHTHTKFKSQSTMSAWKNSWTHPHKCKTPNYKHCVNWCRWKIHHRRAHHCLRMVTAHKHMHWSAKEMIRLTLKPF